MRRSDSRTSLSVSGTSLGDSSTSGSGSGACVGSVSRISLSMALAAVESAGISTPSATSTVWSPRSLAARTSSSKPGSSSTVSGTNRSPTRSPISSGGSHGSVANWIQGIAFSTQIPTPRTRSLRPSSLKTWSTSNASSPCSLNAPRRYPDTLRKKSWRSSAVPFWARRTTLRAFSTSGVNTTKTLPPAAYRCLTRVNPRKRRANCLCRASGRERSNTCSSTSAWETCVLCRPTTGSKSGSPASLTKGSSSNADATTMFSERRWLSTTVSEGSISAICPHMSIRASRSARSARLNSSMASAIVYRGSKRMKLFAPTCSHAPCRLTPRMRRPFAMKPYRMLKSASWMAPLVRTSSAKGPTSGRPMHRNSSEVSPATPDQETLSERPSSISIASPSSRRRTSAPAPGDLAACAVHSLTGIERLPPMCTTRPLGLGSNSKSSNMGHPLGPRAMRSRICGFH